MENRSQRFCHMTNDQIAKYQQTKTKNPQPVGLRFRCLILMISHRDVVNAESASLQGYSLLVQCRRRSAGAIAEEQDSASYFIRRIPATHPTGSLRLFNSAPGKIVT